MTVAPQPRVAVVVPCFRERDHILDVLAAIPECVERIFVIDDGCPDRTGERVEHDCADERVRVITHHVNRGVGAAMRTGYRAALSEHMDIVVKIDGDGQMEPAGIPDLIAPIVDDRADYAKGNRFFRLDGVTSMPLVRLIGNVCLSFVSKFSTGYWQLFDPNNGFTAIDARVLALLPLDSIHAGYFFESDMLFRLNTLRAVVCDVPMRARYGEEQSSLNVRRAAVIFTWLHGRNFAKRLFYNYFLRGFSIASVEWVIGPLLLLFGVLFGLNAWHDAVASGVAATAGTVMLASLPTIIGMQMTLSAIQFDIGTEPTTPIRRLLRRGLTPRARAGSVDDA